MAKTGETDELDPQELKHLRVREVSLVDRPANRRPFLLFKSRAEGSSTMPLTTEENAAIEVALNTAVDGEEGLLKAMAAKAKGGKLTEKDANALKGAIRLLGSSASFADIVKALGDPEPAPDAKPDEKPEEKPDEKPAEKPEDKPEEKPAEGDVEKAHQAELAKANSKITSLEKQVGELVGKADAEAVATLVEEMNLPGMSTEDQQQFVQALSPKLRATLHQWAPGITKAIDLSGTGVGTPRRGQDAPLSAQDELMKRAEEYVTKDASGKLDLADAIVKVRAEDPELAERSRLESLGMGG